jgi:hypothetical protein
MKKLLYQVRKQKECRTILYMEKNYLEFFMRLSLYIERVLMVLYIPQGGYRRKSREEYVLS